MRQKLPCLIAIPEWVAALLTFADIVNQRWLAAVIWIGLLGTRVVRQMITHRRALVRARIRDRTSTGSHPESPTPQPM